MIADFWVAISAKKYKYGTGWIKNGVTLRQTKPSTGPNEVAVKITVEIPDAYFEVPELSALITVPEDAVNKPFITPRVESNIAQVISEQLGMKVHVSTADKDDKK